MTVTIEIDGCRWSFDQQDPASAGFTHELITSSPPPPPSPSSLAKYTPFVAASN